MNKNAKDLDILMPMYNLLKYGKNYSKTSGSLWNYYMNRTIILFDELTDETNDNNGLNKNVINSKSFKDKTSTYNVAATVEGYDANEEGTKKLKLQCH